MSGLWRGQVCRTRPTSYFSAIQIQFVRRPCTLACGSSTHLPTAVWQAERAREREQEREKERERERGRERETARERASGGEVMEMEIDSETARERGERARKREMRQVGLLGLNSRPLACYAPPGTSNKSQCPPTTPLPQT